MRIGLAEPDLSEQVHCYLRAKALNNRRRWHSSCLVKERASREEATRPPCSSDGLAPFTRMPGAK